MDKKRLTKLKNQVQELELLLNQEFKSKKLIQDKIDLINQSIELLHHVKSKKKKSINIAFKIITSYLLGTDNFPDVFNDLLNYLKALLEDD